MDKSQRRLIGAALFFLVGLAFAAIGGFLLWDQEQDIRSAEQVDGTITSSSVDREVTRRDRDDDGFRERSVSYYADISYQYTYNGEQYTSSGVFPGAGQSSVSESRANDLVTQYSEGSAATVYVADGGPNDTFLIKERKLLLPLAFVGFGLVAGFLGGAELYRRFFVK